MKRRASFVIPALTATLAAVGCADPMIGDWEADTFPFQNAEEGPATVNMPYEDVIEYEFRTCTYFYDIGFEFDEELKGELTRKTELACTASNGTVIEPIGDKVDFDLEIEVVEKRSTYEITIENFLNEEDVVLDCSLNSDGNVLDCEDDEGLSSSFEKQED